jgi:hypothetical protein
MLVTLGLVALLWMAIGIAGCYTGDKMIWYVQSIRRQRLKTNK